MKVIVKTWGILRKCEDIFYHDSRKIDITSTWITNHMVTFFLRRKNTLPSNHYYKHPL